LFWRITFLKFYWKIWRVIGGLTRRMVGFGGPRREEFLRKVRKVVGI